MKGSCSSSKRDLHIDVNLGRVNGIKRYDKEGINGLKTRQKSGRPIELSEEASYQIKKELSNSNQGWTTKQAEELIVKKSGIKYHYTFTYTVFFENGDLDRRYCQERYMLIQQHLKRKKRFSKKGYQILVDKQQQPQQQQDAEEEKKRICRSITG